MGKSNVHKIQITKKSITAGATVGLVFIILADVLFVGNAGYYIKWVHCGTRPVVLSHPTELGFGYQPPSNIAWTNPNILREKDPVINELDNTLHCTLDELRNAYGDSLEVCEEDNLVHMVRSLGIGRNC